jgi:hypothetical protein
MTKDLTTSSHQGASRAAIALLASSILLAGCSGEVRPSISVGLDACAQCNMVIDTTNQACGYVHDGHFVTFDSPSCLLRSYDGLRHQGSPPPTEIYFADYGSGEFVSAESVVILLTEHIPTVMDSGALCFSSTNGAEATRSAADEVITDWLGFRRLLGQPDAVVEAQITVDGMSPELVEVNKGDLVLFRIGGGQLHDPLPISIRGYPEVGEIVITPSEEPTELRFFATQPGVGFPVVDGDGKTLGMIRVTGAHTADEESM